MMPAMKKRMETHDGGLLWLQPRRCNGMHEKVENTGFAAICKVGSDLAGRAGSGVEFMASRFAAGTGRGR